LLLQNNQGGFQRKLINFTELPADQHLVNCHTCCSAPRTPVCVDAHPSCLQGSSTPAVRFDLGVQPQLRGSLQAIWQFLPTQGIMGVQSTIAPRVAKACQGWAFVARVAIVWSPVVTDLTELRSSGRPALVCLVFGTHDKQHDWQHK
jgi:hypothetical protein